MFIRPLVSKDSKLPQPMRAGDGIAANFIVKAYAAETDENITLSELSGGYIVQGTTLTSDVTYTLPTAATIAALDSFSAMDVGDTYPFIVKNSQAGAFDVVIAVNTGITKVGTNNTLSTPPQSTNMFLLRKTGAATFDLI